MSTRFTRTEYVWCAMDSRRSRRRFSTALGHAIEYYADPNFQKHALGGILWVLRAKN